jgi:hypothetical protein
MGSNRLLNEALNQALKPEVVKAAARFDLTPAIYIAAQ